MTINYYALRFTFSFNKGSFSTFLCSKTKLKNKRGDSFTKTAQNENLTIITNFYDFLNNIGSKLAYQSRASWGTN